MLLAKRALQAAPFSMATWSPYLVKAKIPQGPGIRPILILATYIQPLNKRELLQELDVTVR